MSYAYATMLFLSFSNFTFVSFNLLFVTDVYTVNGSVNSTVLVYDPAVEQFSAHHLPYAIPAITLLFFLGFCPTIFLLLYSIKPFKKCFKFGPRTQIYLNTFAEAFQACYKDGLDGTIDFRPVSSLSVHVLEVGLLTMMTVVWFDNHIMTPQSLVLT